MNCFEFQHQLNRDPDGLDAAARAHARDCVGCERRLAEQLAADRAIRNALDVEPPAGLAERILSRRRSPRRWPPAALAASVAFALLACGWLLHGSFRSPPALASAMAAHVLGEPGLFSDRTGADASLINASIASIGGAVTGMLPVALAKPCKVPGGDGAHLVFETSAGRAIMTTLPHEDEAGAAVVEEAVISAVYRAPRGAYSLVARNHTAIDLTRALLNRNVDWQI